MNQNEVENELKHWGILGMHWGIRRYQNPDGSLTPEGRERYLKNPNNTKDNSYNEEGKKKFVDPKYFNGNSNKVNMQAVTDALDNSEPRFSPKLSKMQYEFVNKESQKNRYGVSLYSTALYADNKDFKKFMASDDHSRETLKKYLDSKWPFTFSDSDIDPLYNYITNLDKFNNEGKEFIAKQVDKLGVSDSKRDYLINALYEFYIDPVAGVQFEQNEDELKHWGILGMKWGIRNYQNPDGSLTPLGRIRYGVGAKKEITGNIAGVNDANSLSDEELKRMTRRYQQQADYYQARNNYVYQEGKFKEATTPRPKERRSSGIGRFFSNVLGRPLENFMAKSVEFGLGAMGYSVLNDAGHPMAATAFLNGFTGGNFKYETDEEKVRKQLQDQLNKLDLENKIEEAKRRQDKENYQDLEDQLRKLDLENKIEEAKRRQGKDNYQDLEDQLKKLNLENNIREAQRKKDNPNSNQVTPPKSDKDLKSRNFIYQKRQEMMDLFETNLNNPDFDFDKNLDEAQYLFGDEFLMEIYNKHKPK